MVKILWRVPGDYLLSRKGFSGGVGGGGVVVRFGVEVGWGGCNHGRSTVETSM